MRLLITTFGIITLFILVIAYLVLGKSFADISPFIYLTGFVLWAISQIVEFKGKTGNPRNKVAFLYGGFAVLIGGGFLVTITSLNSAFFLPPCLIGLFMIFLYLRNNAQKPEVGVKNESRF